jgi:hypothetical protein
MLSHTISEVRSNSDQLRLNGTFGMHRLLSTPESQPLGRIFLATLYNTSPLQTLLHLVHVDKTLGKLQ